jgi:hypothetical protein
VKAFKMVAEKQEAEKAIVAVTLTGRNTPPRKSADRTVRYDFVRDNGDWKIDDIKGARQRAMVDPRHAHGGAQELAWL